MARFTRSNRKSLVSTSLSQLLRGTVRNHYADTKLEAETVIATEVTAVMRYSIVEMDYDGRRARVLFSGNRVAAQSGIPLDDNDDLLFDYNQRLLEAVISLRPTTVLVIGGGAYTLPMALIDEFPKMLVTVVEIDEQLQGIAKRHFNLRKDKHLRIIHTDGRAFIENCSEKFDLIILDAFSHTAIPKKLVSAAAARSMHRILTTNGAIAINLIGSYYGRNSELVRSQYKVYKKLFSIVEIFPANRSLLSFWLSQNFVLIAQKGTPKSLDIRFAALDPPSQSDQLI